MRAWLLALVLLSTGCGCGDDEEPDTCRFDPERCAGGPGGFCGDDYDCETGFCCDSGNCGGGMCTYPCGDDGDCPGGMLCEHDTCFYECFDDLDCAEGMSCEHGQTVCEWQG